MAHPRSAYRPRRRSTSKTSSFLSKIAFAAVVLMAVLCFMPAASNSVRAEDDKESYGTVIGIDLGTTYSCVA